MKRCIGRLLVGVLVAGLAVALAPVARADVTITMETVTLAGRGPAQKTTTVQYYKGTKTRSDTGKQSVSIIDLDKERVVTLLPSSKRYTVQTLDQLKQMAAAFGAMQPKVEVNKTDEEQQINGYHCRKVVVQTAMMGTTTTTEMWVTKDVQMDSAVTAFQKNGFDKFKDIPMLAGPFQAMKEMADEGAFPIKTVSVMKTPTGTITTTQTVTKIEPGDLDDSLFEIPAGYKEIKTPSPFGAG